MKSLLKTALRRAGRYEQASSAWMWIEPRLSRLVRALTRMDRRLLSSYLAAHPEPKLHIGCGDNHLRGWLNTDLCPRGDQIYLNAIRAFPLPSDTFAFVYSEHMIEHIAYQDGEAMLRECLRVLRPGGIIRIVTPNLTFLTTLLEPDLTPAQSAYVQYSTDAHKIAGPVGSGTHVFNHFMRAWGHQFIYDLESMTRTLAETGFEDITPTALADSVHLELRGLAKADRMPPPFLEMESIVIEGRKPMA